jgi:hypothetical protein
VDNVDVLHKYCWRLTGVTGLGTTPVPHYHIFRCRPSGAAASSKVSSFRPILYISATLRLLTTQSSLKCPQLLIDTWKERVRREGKVTTGSLSTHRDFTESLSLIPKRPILRGPLDSSSLLHFAPNAVLIPVGSSTPNLLNSRLENGILRSSRIVRRTVTLAPRGLRKASMLITCGYPWWLSNSSDSMGGYTARGVNTGLTGGTGSPLRCDR